MCHDGPGLLMPHTLKLNDLLDANIEHLGTDAPRILDVASGSGEPACTFAAAHTLAQVTATDFAEGMVEVGKQRALDKGLKDIRFAMADANDLVDFNNDSFDVVSCALALFLIPDPARCLREFRRVLRPGGLLIISVWGLPPRLDFVRAYMHAINQLFPDTPARQPKSLNLGDPSQLEGVVRDAGFRAAKFSECNVEFDLRTADVRTAFMRQPMLVSSHKELEGQGISDPGAAVLAALEEGARLEGCMTAEGMVFPTNVAVICTAWAL